VYDHNQIEIIVEEDGNNHASPNHKNHRDGSRNRSHSLDISEGNINSGSAIRNAVKFGDIGSTGDGFGVLPNNP
jgi:hypothetical protein